MTARRAVGLLVFGASTFVGVSCDLDGIYYRILTGAPNRLRDADGDRVGRQSPQYPPLFVSKALGWWMLVSRITMEAEQGMAAANHGTCL